MKKQGTKFKKLFIFLLLMGLLLAPACGGNNKPGSVDGPSNSENIADKTGEANSSEKKNGAEKTSGLEKTNGAEKTSGAELDASGISKIIIKDLESSTVTEHTDSGMIKEFCAFIGGMPYSPLNIEQYDYYKIELTDTGGNTAAVISVSGWTIAFDRDILLEGKHFKEGVYNAGRWISPYIKKFTEGTVLDPVYIHYPALIKIPDEIVTQQLYDHGKTKINSEDVNTGIYDFLNGSFINKEFTVLNSRRFFDRKQMEDMLSEIKNMSESIVVSFSTSATFAEIKQNSEIRQCAEADVIAIAPVSGKPGMFQLVTNNMVFEIDAGNDFASGFNSIFTANRSMDTNLTPEDIRELFEEKKPYYMEFICKNLGIENWQGREPDRLEISSVKLNEENEPYTVVSIYNPFDVRLLVFAGEKGKQPKFIDYIDFGGRAAGTDYHLETGNGHVWIVGNICRGYGTGESSYYQDWYGFSPNGKKLVLSFPYDDYSSYHAGGYSIKAENIQIKTGGKMRVCVDYAFTRWYPLQIDIVSRDGMVTVKSRKTAEFVFDQSNGVFISEYAVDENGITVVDPVPFEITVQCDVMLEKYFDMLAEWLKSGKPGEERFKTEARFEGMRRFLDDCSNSDKKAELEEMLESEFRRFFGKS